MRALVTSCMCRHTIKTILHLREHLVELAPTSLNPPSHDKIQLLCAYAIISMRNLHSAAFPQLNLPQPMGGDYRQN